MDPKLLCAAMAAFCLLLLFSLAFSRPRRGSWIDFKEQRCLSNLSCFASPPFCVVLGFV